MADEERIESGEGSAYPTEISDNVPDDFVGVIVLPEQIKSVHSSSDTKTLVLVLLVVLLHLASAILVVMAVIFFVCGVIIYPVYLVASILLTVLGLVTAWLYSSAYKLLEKRISASGTTVGKEQAIDRLWKESAEESLCEVGDVSGLTAKVSSSASKVLRIANLVVSLYLASALLMVVSVIFLFCGIVDNPIYVRVSVLLAVFALLTAWLSFRVRVCTVSPV
jgi:membrane protein implicated in regulation of membrane protease activity